MSRALGEAVDLDLSVVGVGCVATDGVCGGRDGASSVDGDASVVDEDTGPDASSKGGVFQRLHEEVRHVTTLALCTARTCV
jgi:hypothetical protein